MPRLFWNYWAVSESLLMDTASALVWIHIVFSSEQEPSIITSPSTVLRPCPLFWLQVNWLICTRNNHSHKKRWTQREDTVGGDHPESCCYPSPRGGVAPPSSSSSSSRATSCVSRVTPWLTIYRGRLSVCPHHHHHRLLSVTTSPSPPAACCCCHTCRL